MTPVPQSIQIAHEHAILLAEADLRDGPCDLSRDERPAPSWGFMIEQYTTIHRQCGPMAILTVTHLAAKIPYASLTDISAPR